MHLYELLLQILDLLLQLCNVGVVVELLRHLYVPEEEEASSAGKGCGARITTT